MLEMLRDLVGHKGHADVTILAAIRQHQAAAGDPLIGALLHHTLLANRFWLLTILGRPFIAQIEARPADSFEDLVHRYATTLAAEAAWLATATEADLARVLVDPPHPRRVVFGGAGVHAGVPALARPPGAVREAAAGTRGGAPDDGLHPVGSGSPRTAVAATGVGRRGRVG